MATHASGTGVADEHYNLVSVLYHVLQGAETNEVYIKDARQAGDQDLATFFQEVQDSYRKIGSRAKELLKQRIA